MGKTKNTELPNSRPRIMLSEKLMKILVARDGDKYCAYCPELDLITAADSTSEVLQSMVEEIREYAEEYINEIDLYSKSPNISHHLPYIQAVQDCENDWELMTLLEIK